MVWAGVNKNAQHKIPIDTRRNQMPSKSKRCPSKQVPAELADRSQAKMRITNESQNSRFCSENEAQRPHQRRRERQEATVEGGLETSPSLLSHRELEGGMRPADGRTVARADVPFRHISRPQTYRISPWTKNRVANGLKKRATFVRPHRIRQYYPMCY